ncbi:MAG TPA: cryptochrome/photolyase family protein, partial [Alcaligenaceae bacterium]|nr:cryptochrome/photolyase family protein [Alcaligenaceae bacterium]
MKMRPTLRLILGDQLNPLHSWFDQSNDQVIYVLMEVRSETDYVLHHAQKVLGIFAAMRAFSDRLKSTGHRVRYIRIDHPSNRHQITSNLDALIDHYDAKSVEYQEPDEWRLDKNIKDWASNCRVPVKMV